MALKRELLLAELLHEKSLRPMPFLDLPRFAGTRKVVAGRPLFRVCDAARAELMDAARDGALAVYQGLFNRTGNMYQIYVHILPKKGVLPGIDRCEVISNQYNVDTRGKKV